MTLRIELTETMFGEKERQLLTMGAFRVSTFRYDSGIAALRVKMLGVNWSFFPSKAIRFGAAHSTGANSR